MRFPNHVSLSTDIVALMDYSPVIATGHEYAGLTPPFVIPMVPHIEPPTTMWWFPGNLIGKNKFSSNVVHKNDTIALDGHDVGPLIPHVISQPPDNIMLVVSTLKSKRKTNFSVGDVKSNGKPIAACTMFDLAIIPTPMTPCSLIPIPCCGTGSAVWTNEVIVGMHWIDLVAGWVNIVLDMILALATFGGRKVGAIPSFTPLVAGLIRMAGQEWFGYRGDAELKIEAESDGVTASVSLSRAGDDGRWTAQQEARVGGELNNLHEQGSVSWGGTSGQGVVVTGQGGATLLGQSGDVGVSNDRPGDHQIGGFATGSSPAFGSGSTPIGPGLESFPEL